ncbi:MAG: PhnD/SsuA/transferrin family substrate-binding protein [Nitrospirae bacterium]|nr:PhnD/SsuA/transferrin family substrate-binding protein [Nitrospirota bacterium]
MPFKISTKFFIKFFFGFSAVFFLIFSGCVRQETPKKVSLLKRAVEISVDVNDIEKNTLKFGFDLRLDPKEDVRIYSPFLEYLQNAAGKRFSIKFTEKYEDTVDNLGKGITHFAAIGPLNYIAGREKYGNGIRYLASGVNKEGDPRYQAVLQRLQAQVRLIMLLGILLRRQ